MDSGTEVLHEDLEGNIWVNPGEDLDEDGVVWDMDVHNFENRIKELQDYKTEFGNFNIPSNYKPNPNLGNYVYRIKTKGIKAAISH